MNTSQSVTGYMEQCTSKVAHISGILDPFSQLFCFVCVCIQMFCPGSKWLSYQECYLSSGPCGVHCIYIYIYILT